jgi:hypothetical protein
VSRATNNTLRHGATSLLLGLVLLTGVPTAESSLVQNDPSIVGIWTFDEGSGTSVADSSGRDNKGTLKGAPAWVAGQSGKALSFGSGDDYVSCGVTGMPEANAPQTLAGWFQVAEIPTETHPFIHLEGGKGSSLSVGFRNSKIVAWKQDGVVLVDSAAPTPGAWHHVAYTFDGKIHTLFVDGALAGSTNIAPSTGKGIAKVELGRFKGSLDEIRIHTKALTEADIARLIPPDKRAKAPPAGSKSSKQAAREKKAAELWEAAEKFEKEGKLAEAQAKLREFRARFRGTMLYFDKMVEISEKINVIGLKLAVTSLGKTTFYKRPHQDSWHAYEFNPPEGWKGVPPRAQWVGENDSEEAYLKGKTTQVARYTAPYLDKLSLQVFKSYATTSLAYLETQVMSYLDERYKKTTEESSSQFPTNRGNCVRKVYTTPGGDRLVCYFYFGEKIGLALCGIWRSGSEESGFIITTVTSGGVKTVRESKDDPITPENFGYALKIFDQCAKTFWIYDQGTRQGMRTKLDRSALCSDWQTMRSSKGSYFIEYATSAEYAKRCGEELEQILALYRQVIPTGRGSSQCRVKIFDREDDFMYYSGAYGAAAYWSPSQEEIVCFKFEGDKVKMDSGEEHTVADERNPEEVTFKILYHEAFHQYMFYLMGRGRNIYVPSWLNEGLGDYFFGGEWSKNPRKFAIGINDWRIKTIHKAVKEDKHVSIDKIIRYEQAQYYNNAGLCYAEGWSLNYFFLTSPVAKKKGYHLLPQQMVEALKVGSGWEKATDKVFAGLDLKKMEEEWKAFVLELPISKGREDDGDED